MKLTLQLQLLPDTTQRRLLLATMRAFNAGASHAARVGFEAQRINLPFLHDHCYRELRERFGLSSQMAVRAIGKAVEVLRRDKTCCSVFRPTGAMIYDERLMSFKGVDRVSLLTLEGRQIVPLIYGEYQRKRFDRMKGQCDLIYRRGRFYLLATIDLPESAPIAVNEFLGVDLGIVQLATDSDGTSYSGNGVERVRCRQQETRARLQRRGSRGARKLLRRLAQRESHYRHHENHRISKQIVACAKDTKRGIALEDLTHIRSRTTVRRIHRARHACWAFAQLRAFIAYKAQFAGVPLVLVNPRNSSRTCSDCGYCAKGNRTTRNEFRCLHCGSSLPADLNAARNIRAWAACKPASALSTASAA